MYGSKGACEGDGPAPCVRKLAWEWLSMAREVNVSIAKDNQELQTFVVEARHVLRRAASLPAGCAGSAAKALRDERVVLARRIAQSPAKARQPYRPLLVPPAVGRTQEAAQRVPAASLVSGSLSANRNEANQANQKFAEAPCQDGQEVAEAITALKQHGGRSSGSSEAVTRSGRSEAGEAMIRIEGSSASTCQRHSLSENLRDILIDLCQSVEADVKHQSNFDHTNKVEASDVFNSSRHSLSDSAVEIAANACSSAITRRLQSNSLDGCEMSSLGEVADVAQLSEISEHIDEQHAVVAAFAQLTHSIACNVEAKPSQQAASAPTALGSTKSQSRLNEQKGNAETKKTWLAKEAADTKAAKKTQVERLAKEDAEAKAAKQAEEERLAKEAAEAVAAKQAQEERL
ncbi:FAZ1, partial [Symbiodinium pilosum]